MSTWLCVIYVVLQTNERFHQNIQREFFWCTVLKHNNSPYLGVKTASSWKTHWPSDPCFSWKTINLNGHPKERDCFHFAV